MEYFHNLIINDKRMEVAMYLYHYNGLDIDNKSFEIASKNKKNSILVLLNVYTNDPIYYSTEEDIANLVKYLNERKVKTRIKFNPETCSICLEYLKRFRKYGELECGHKFHLHCIKKTLQYYHSCPLCRLVID